MNAADHLDAFLKDTREDYVIQCKNPRDQEALRVSLYHYRKKLERFYPGMIGISRETINGFPCVVLSDKTTKQAVFKRGADGKLRPVGQNDMASGDATLKDNQRIIELMVRDGLPEEEIIAAKKEFGLEV